MRELMFLWQEIERPGINLTQARAASQVKDYQEFLNGLQHSDVREEIEALVRSLINDKVDGIRATGLVYTAFVNLTPPKVLDIGTCKILPMQVY